MATTEDNYWHHRLNQESNFTRQRHDRLMDYDEEMHMQAMRPSTCYKPKISMDGNQFCASVGPNPMEGVYGYGDTVKLAFEDFDREWNEKKIEINKLPPAKS